MIVTSVANVYAQIYYFSGHREHSDSNHNSNGNTTLSNDYLQFLNNSEYYEWLKHYKNVLYVPKTWSLKLVPEQLDLQFI